MAGFKSVVVVACSDQLEGETFGMGLGGEGRRRDEMGLGGKGR